MACVIFLSCLRSFSIEDESCMYRESAEDELAATGLELAPQASAPPLRPRDVDMTTTKRRLQAGVRFGE
jgi:hypothetical protein